MIRMDTDISVTIERINKALEEDIFPVGGSTIMLSVDDVCLLLNDHSRLQAAISAFHRRAQAAEAGVGVTVEDCRREGVSLGRTLANAGYRALEEERDRLARHAEALAAGIESVIEPGPEHWEDVCDPLEGYRAEYPGPSDGRLPSKEAP